MTRYVTTYNLACVHAIYAAERVSESSQWRTNWIHSSWHFRHRQEHHSYGRTFINEFCFV